jgi:hypothetical protein
MKHIRAVVVDKCKSNMEADNCSDISENCMQYSYIAETMELIIHLFDSDRRKLEEFTENVDAMFKLVDPSKHDVLLKFLTAKIMRGT